MRSCQTPEEALVCEQMRTLHVEQQRLMQAVLCYVWKLTSLHRKQFIAQNSTVHIPLPLWDKLYLDVFQYLLWWQYLNIVFDNLSFRDVSRIFHNFLFSSQISYRRFEFFPVSLCIISNSVERLEICYSYFYSYVLNIFFVVFRFSINKINIYFLP